MAESISNCKNVFITWTWGIGIITGGIIVLATVLSSYTKAEVTQDNTLVNQSNKINAVELRVCKLEVIQKDLDTVKLLLRANTKTRR